jgi:hypothetical protein
MKVGDLVRTKNGLYSRPIGIVLCLPQSPTGRGFVKVHWSWNIGPRSERWSALEIINEAG